MTIIRYSTMTVLCSFALLAPARAKTVTVGTIDPKATRETKALFYNLRELAKSKLLFGHQDTTAYGVGWSVEEGRSDVKSVTGSVPGRLRMGHRTSGPGEESRRCRVQPPEEIDQASA